MSRLAWVAGAFSLLGLIGCLPEGGANAAPMASPPAYATPSFDTLSYDDGTPLMTGSSDPAALAFEAELLALVNNHRVSIGLDALQDSEELRELARAHSLNMATAGFFDHLNQQGQTVVGRASQAGLAYSYVTENIAGGYATAASVIAAWLASPGHRLQLENPDVTEAGAGLIVVFPDWNQGGMSYYATQVYAQP